MTSTMNVVRTALLMLIAVALIFLLVRIEFRVNGLRHSPELGTGPPRIHQPQGQLSPKSDPSPPDFPNTVDATIFV